MHGSYVQVHLNLDAQVSGQIDQTAGMLDQEVKDKGYALLCVAEPRSDCVIRIIEEVRVFNFACNSLFEAFLKSLAC
jgi:hypothetical protein